MVFRFGDIKPVFILTSHRTYSCAEGFAFVLQARARATIVGETTGGGAHIVSERPIDEHFTIRIPADKVIVPNRSDDWEGIGVAPDGKTSAAAALKNAHLLAIGKLLELSPPGPHHEMLERANDAVSHYH